MALDSERSTLRGREEPHATQFRKVKFTAPSVRIQEREPRGGEGRGFLLRLRLAGASRKEFSFGVLAGGREYFDDFRWDGVLDSVSYAALLCFSAEVLLACERCSS